MWNKYQTQEEEINIDSLPDEVREEFYECLNIPFIKWLISPDRPRAKDLPRDENGRIIVDVTKPHILEDMDYFRPTALHYQKTGRLTDLKPNGNPNSAFGKWIKEEVRRCWEGYVRESDGEWIPGNFYYFLNYFPIAQTKTVVGSNKGKRIIDFPEVWDGNYLRYHYIEQAQHGGLFNWDGGLNGAEISARGKTKSLSMAAIMSKYFTLGESGEISRAVKVMAMAYSKEYLINDGILNKFQASLDFIATNTQFPHLLLKNSLQDMSWIMGWKNLDTGAREGTLNEASGVAVKDDVGKIRGKRLNFVIAEEFGSFANIREIYNILLPSIREGKFAFGTAYLIGCVCAGTKVWTNSGNLINIEQIKREDGIVGFNDGIINVGPVEGCINGCTRQLIGSDIMIGKKPCYRITLSNGNYIECSNDHPILINIKHRPRIKNSNLRYTYYSQRFIEADKIKIGDSVCEARCINIFGDKTLFDSRLVGMLIGDGTYGFDNTPVYSSEDAELLDYIKNKYDWSLSVSHTTKSNKKYEEIRVKGICKYLREIGIYGQTKTKKRLPDNFLELTRNDLSLLLSGIVDTDGCVYKDKKDYGINICQSSIEILEQIRAAFRKFGVIGSITKTNPRVCKERKDKNPWYTLVMCGRNNILNLQKCLSLLVTRKSNKLLEGSEYYKQHKSLRNQKYSEQYLCYKVVSVEFLGEKDVYNLCASASHTYLANNIITHNTSGEKQSDFNQATEIIYNPKGYYMYALPNVYDKPGEGRKQITFFFPEYINRKGCYDENGNSDVTKALIEILIDRYRIKYNTTDLNTITRSIAERPITPQEALLKSRGNKFPVNELNQRLNELDANSAEFDDVFVGELVETGEGNVEFRPTADQSIRVYPIENNMTKGALEIFCMPQKDSNDRVPQGRYIASCLPEGELVSTDRGLVPINEVTLNDKLLNISGKFVNIIKIKSRIANESIYKFKLRTIYDTVSFTGEHPIFCCTPKVKYHHSKFAQRNNLPYRYKKYNFEFKKAKDIKAGDVVISPNRYRKVINFDDRWENCSRVDFNVKSPLRDKRFWWIIGLMLGDGWASNNGYSISCSFNAKEKLYIDRFKEYCEDIFKRDVCFSKNHKTCKEQTFSCKDFNYFFAKNFGIGAKNKNIPEWVKYIDEEYKIALILGYFAADGCATGDSIEFVSISKKLLIDIQDILFSIGINCGITKLRNKKNNCKIRGKVVNQQETFHLRIAKIGLTKMREWDKDDIKLKRLTYKYDENNAKKDIKKIWFSDDLNYIYFTIDSIEESHYDGVVYNFECDTHTYMCGHIPTHNCDPIDQDITTDSTSLYSTFVLDLFTDNVVAEYTGRKEYAEQNYEVSRLLCIFYNCKLLYENNLKGAFSYFSKIGCLNLLADTPEYLQDKELLKLGTIGNTTKGVRATKAVNNYADDLSREWLIQPETIIKKNEDGEEVEVTRKKLFSLKNRALIMEFIRYNNYENFDRVRSFGLLMLYREQFRIAAGGDVTEEEETSASNLAFDPFFTRIFNKD